MRHVYTYLGCLVLPFLFSCGNSASTDENASREKGDSVSAESPAAAIKEEAINYRVGDTEMKSFVAYSEDGQGRRPVVLVIPEWWGLTDYPRMRARQLAQMGYLAMAVDMYGEGRQAADPGEAGKLATPFYQQPAMGLARMQAALAEVNRLPQADTTRSAAIGYCFGGTMVLNAAKLGMDLDGVVSLHGGLEGPAPRKNLLKARIQVLHGGADNLVPEAQVASFRKGLDSISAAYEFIVYPGATHAFTNPDATKKGETFGMPIRYNGAADSASFRDMSRFLGTVLGKN
jgi:dienelactone hydrolase